MKRQSPFNISTKLGLTAGVPLLFVAILGIAGTWAIDGLLNTQRWVLHTKEVVLSISEIEKLLIDLETGKRGYLITGEEKFLEPYVSAKAMLFDHLEMIIEKVDDNPTQVERLEALKEVIRQWFTESTLIGYPESEIV